MNSYETEVFEIFCQKVDRLLNKYGVKCPKSRVAYKRMIFNQLLFSEELYEDTIKNGQLKKVCTCPTR